jgi:hypothetical protein
VGEIKRRTLERQTRQVFSGASEIRCSISNWWPLLHSYS